MAEFTGKAYSIEQSLRELEKDLKNLTAEMTEKARRNVELLAGTAHSMIVKKVNAKLHSTAQMYLDNLAIKKISESGDNVIHAVLLYKPAKFLEDGQNAHNMIDYLVNGKSGKTAKDGSKYAVIPFHHNKNPRSAAQDKITQYINTELKHLGLDKVITRDGKPIIGRAATVDMIKRGSPQSEKTWKPLLEGVTIYQSEVKNRQGQVLKKQNGEARIRRDIMTFRVVSTKQIGKGLWDNPGRPGLKAFEEVVRELDPIWDAMIQELVK